MAKETIFSVSLSVDRKDGPRNPIWTVVKFEVIRQLKKPSFWISLLLLPLMILVIIGLSALSSTQTEQILTSMDVVNGKTIAILDEAKVIDEKLFAEEGFRSVIGENTGLKVFSEAEAGIEAVKNGEVSIFYHIPADFIENKEVKYYSRQEGKGLMTNYETPLRALLSASAYAKTTPEDALILTNGYQMKETTYDNGGKEVNLLGQAVVPLAILAIFYILICVFGNRLLMAVVEEKENRISEMILTATSARDLIIGKIIALILLGFIQILVFIIPAVAILFLNRENPMLAGILGVIEWNPATIAMNVALLLFSYFFFAGACTLVGTLVPTAREASQFVAPVMIGMVLPLYFLQVFVSGEQSLLTYILSYFPLSSSISMMLRNAFGTLPFWEFVLGLIEIGACSAITLWLTVRTFQRNAINFSVVKLNFKPKKTWKR